MATIALAAFGVVILALGLVCISNPSGVRLFGERLGGRSRFSELTVDRSIRMSGVIAVVMAAFVFWSLMYGQ